MSTKAEITKAQLEAIRAIADAIKELKEVPSGHLYARVMGYMGLDTYQSIIGILKRTGLVSEDGFHVLRWEDKGK